MFTNGGTSMRDAMNRVTDIVKELAKDTAMSVAQNRALSEQSAIGMFQGDIEGAVIWSNEALRQLTGLRPEQIAGRGWIGGVDAADRRLVESDWRCCQHGEPQSVYCVVPFLTQCCAHGCRRYGSAKSRPSSLTQRSCSAAAIFRVRRQMATRLSSEVSAVRAKIGNTTLSILTAVLLALLSWGGKQIIGSFLTIDAFNTHVAHDALHDQLDSIHFAKLDREIKTLRCAKSGRGGKC